MAAKIVKRTPVAGGAKKMVKRTPVAGKRAPAPPGKKRM